MKEIEKKKNDQPLQRGMSAGDKQLILALLIPVLFFFGATYLITSESLFRYSGALSPIYSLHLLALSSPFLTLMLIGAAIAFLRILVRAPKRGSTYGCGLIVFLIGITFFLFNLMFSIFTDQVTPLQSLSHQDHVYRLFYVEFMGSRLTPQAYIVVECDSLGLACDYYATPIWLEDWVQNKLIEMGNDYGQSGRLVVNEEDQTLYLQANDHMYSMVRRCGIHMRDRDAVKTDPCQDI